MEATQNRTSVKYGIWVTYYFHDNTFYAPVDDWLYEMYEDNPIEFSTKEEAQRCIDDECEIRGTYYLSHGEYAMPTYKVKPIRN